MSDPRILSLTLMTISVVTFLGTTYGSLPPISFFPALGLFAIGAFLFLRTNHTAMNKAEQRAQRKSPPRMSPIRQASRPTITPIPLESSNRPQQPAANYDRRADALDIEFDDEELVVSADVSFPLEVQAGDTTLEQLGKLNQMLDQQMLTEEEFEIAKAKLLD